VIVSFLVKPRWFLDETQPGYLRWRLYLDRDSHARLRSVDGRYSPIQAQLLNIGAH